jgi:hypothetical protein
VCLKRGKCVLVVLLGLGIQCMDTPAYAQTEIFVDQAVVGGNDDGSDWENAFDDLEEALAAPIESSLIDDHRSAR